MLHPAGLLRPRRADAALLQTCRAVYAECWHLSLAMREQVHWATREAERAPPGYDFEAASHKMGVFLRAAREQRGGLSFEIQSLRVFAQTYMLEWGHMARLLRTQHLHPRSVTLTIRHTDWPDWRTTHR